MIYLRELTAGHTVMQRGYS